VIQAILFDLDGTLLNTIGDLTDSVNLMLVEHAAPRHDEQTIKGFVGDGIEFLVQRALPQEHRYEEMITYSVERVRKYYSQRWNNKTRPYDGIPELLDALHQQKLTLAILSNKPHQPTLEITKFMLGRWPFDPILGARDGIPKKPDPTVALQIAEQKQIAPNQWIYLGDSGIDMKTARAAGMVAVGVTWGFRTIQELKEGGAQHLIDSPEQLLDLL
jgi:phosphoglycolate phosphatase